MRIEVLRINIFTEAGHLIGGSNYKELNPPENYHSCDRLFVDHSNKTFSFTTEEKINKLNKA